ncbi:uncharacterized protein LOC105851003 isoform X1 [Hydra vulgaris]|uniref:uncharacterized protein LOC105851003 isoform X1 n=1 Tax=Hydra vulgaris TaxID=6087 RepID=UPI00064136AF|nr:uncharacterized protein LOC105851003 [Hydra vulgaris]
MCDVLLLYDERYEFQALKVCNWLKKQKLTVSLNEKSGHYGKAKVYIICLSLIYSNSEKCMKYLDYAADIENRIIIVMFEEFKPAKKNILYTKFWHNITKDIDSDTKKFEVVMNTLLDEINTSLKAFNETKDIEKEQEKAILLYKESLLNKPLKEYHWLTDLKRVLDIENKVDRLFEYYPFTDADLQTIIQTDYGGGKPAQTFFEMLRQRKYNSLVSELRNVFICNQLDKAAKVLEKYDWNCRISDISSSDFSNLSVILSPLPTRPQEDWITVAECFDLGDLVPICKQSSRRQNCYSRTEALLGIIYMKWPNHTIEDFMENLVLCNLCEAVDVIQKQIQKVAKNKVLEKK